MSDTKTCSRCERDKTLSFFGAARNKPDGLQGWCRDCRREHDHSRRDAYRKRQQASRRNWRKKNADKVRQYSRENWCRHRERKCATTRSKWAARKLKVAIWRDKNAQRLASYYRKRRNTDLHYSIKGRLSSRIRAALKAAGSRKCKKTEVLIGCSVARLLLHIEALFLPGMTWENRDRWHIDHKRPCDSFDLTDECQQSQCFHWSNLQPLWSEDNVRKGASYGQ